MKTQIQSKAAEIKQQLRQLGSPQLELAGVNVGRINDTGTVGRNTTTPSPKPSNTQPSQNGSNKKPTEDKGTGKGGTPKGFEKQAKSANDISKKANEGKIKYASNYHVRLGKEKELEILSNPDSVYVAGNNSQNLIYMKGGNVVIVECKGSHKGNTITSYGSDGARGESGAAIFGGKPTDPGKPVTHDAIVNGTIPTPSGGTMPPATQILP
ncbi:MULTISPECIES: hypothetical protein [Lysinibacillus]|uniref:hypothetical protein n=1 Tax=Lysinibacillus TaxID=400634 RepID=UPI0005AD3124|nr:MULTISPECIES: hypothetical protein [Lysinibacillus]AJK87227.1 hypothetical protein HR49_08670 [Lysinibacillus fusiformis]